jgi:hypothetical protein
MPLLSLGIQPTDVLVQRLVSEVFRFKDIIVRCLLFRMTFFDATSNADERIATQR